KSPQRIHCLYIVLSPASSSVTPHTLKSSFAISIYILYGLSLNLLPGSSIFSIFLPTYNPTPPDHMPKRSFLAFLTKSPNHPTCAVPLSLNILVITKSNESKEKKIVLYNVSGIPEVIKLQTMKKTCTKYVY
ncbi:hypothetical protein SK128_021150, partial [Halocaridina rubra]